MSNLACRCLLQWYQHLSCETDSSRFATFRVNRFFKFFTFDLISKYFIEIRSWALANGIEIERLNFHIGLNIMTTIDISRNNYLSEYKWNEKRQIVRFAPWKHGIYSIRPRSEWLSSLSSKNGYYNKKYVLFVSKNGMIDKQWIITWLHKYFVF